MRSRIRRTLFTAAAGLCLVWCLALAGMWIRSCFVCDRFEYAAVTEEGPPRVTVSHYLFLRRGAIEYKPVRITYGAGTPVEDLPPRPEGRVVWRTLDPARGVPLRWFRFERTRSNLGAPAITEFTEVYIPFWFLCLLTAVLPALWLRRRHRTRRCATAGLCIACGYDLRASKERCPECGTAITQEP